MNIYHLEVLPGRRNVTPNAATFYARNGSKGNYTKCVIFDKALIKKVENLESGNVVTVRGHDSMRKNQPFVTITAFE